MVNPIRGPARNFPKPAGEKKSGRKMDPRVKKVLKQSQVVPSKSKGPLKATKNGLSEHAYIAAEKAAAAARQRAFATRDAAVKAQKAAFLAERAHLAQQAAAAKRALAAEKANKAALKAAKKAATLRKLKKIKAYLARPEEKKHSKFLKKRISRSAEKKKSS